MSTKKFIVSARSRWPRFEKDVCSLKANHHLAVISQNTDIQEFRLNFLARIGEELKKCGWTQSPGPMTFILPRQSPDGSVFDWQEVVSSSGSIKAFKILEGPISFGE